ncbi:hypothetical protein ACWCPO_21685 [Streptomyces albidoflavus]
MEDLAKGGASADGIDLVHDQQGGDDGAEDVVPVEGVHRRAIFFGESTDLKRP